MSVTRYTVRMLDQEIDAIAICPFNPDLLVVGTYSLVQETQSPSLGTQNDEHEAEATKIPQSRVGSIQVLAIDCPQVAVSVPSLVPMHRFGLQCAILDIHFCPFVDTIIGAATSVGELMLFRMKGFPERLPRIVPIGAARVSDDIQEQGSNSPAIITQFVWLPKTVSSVNSLVNQESVAYFVAMCDTTGKVQIIKIPIDQSNDEVDDPQNLRRLTTQSVQVHTHLYGLEAWTVSSIPIPAASGLAYDGIILSGGDDGCLISSMYTLMAQEFSEGSIADTDDAASFHPPKRLHIDKSSHTSGVVSILPLPGPFLSNSLPIDLLLPLLTGSYDQSVRLFILDSVTRKIEFISSFEIEGGVWRITLLETYSKHGDNDMVFQHYLLLVSAMHAGCYIMRLIYDISKPLTHASAWTWRIEARFQEPHSSMVYASTARQIRTEEGIHERVWQVVSTSFYDKRICVWHWADGRGQVI